MEDYVLVEVVADHIGGATVVLAAVCQDQSAELLELAYRVVSCGAGLAALESRDTDADVSLSDHSDIVRAITYRQHDLVWIVLLHESDKVRLLLGAHTT